MTDKKKLQLGMNPSTASHRLVKDVLWKLIQETGQSLCCKCGEQMSRETFSIEHIEPWLDSKNPVELYFDLDNIGFSHLKCNVADKRDTRVLKPCGTNASYGRGCRCEECVNEWNRHKRSVYDPEARSERYRRTGR